MAKPKLYKDKDGRYRVEGLGRYASKAEQIAAGVASASGGSGADRVVAVNGGAGNDRIIVNNGGGGGGGKRRGGGGGGGGGGGLALRSETVTRIREEDAVDLVVGILQGLRLRAEHQSVNATYAEAQELWNRAHPEKGEGAQAKRDAAEIAYGRQVAALFGRVALVLGWTPEMWVACMPRELAAARAGDAPGAPQLIDADTEGDGIVDDVAALVAQGAATYFLGPEAGPLANAATRFLIDRIPGGSPTEVVAPLTSKLNGFWGVQMPEIPEIPPRPTGYMLRDGMGGVRPVGDVPADFLIDAEAASGAE